MGIPFLTRLLTRLAESAPEVDAEGGGARFEVSSEPQFGWTGVVRFHSGKRLFFRGTSLDVNSMGAAAVARDKAYTKYFLNAAGFRVPTGMLVYAPGFQNSTDRTEGHLEAAQWAAQNGYPVVVKPNSRSEGLGVSVCHSPVELPFALSDAFKFDRVAIVEEFIPGADTRVAVLHGKMRAAYRRIPLNVTGNGHDSIVALLENKLASLAAAGRKFNLTINDPRLALRMSVMGLTPHSVPANGENIRLLENANLSTGGDAEDLSETLPPELARMAEEAAETVGLKWAGVDFMIPQNAPPVILEINGAPSLKHYSALSPKAEARTLAIYRDLLNVFDEGGA